MKQVKLSITESYISHWGYWQGVRELLQNAVDTKSYDVIFGNDNIKIMSYGGKIPISALLLGKTTKEGDDSTIGKFGEGMKLGFLVLKRLGAGIVVNNAGDLWSPEMVFDEMFNERVLAVNIEEGALIGDGSTVEIGINNIPPEAIEEIKSKFAPAQDLEVVIESYRGKAYSKKGDHKNCRVFVNGVFITEVKGKFKFDYDFAPLALSLDRDRNTANSFEVKYEAAKLLQESSDILLLAELATEYFDDLVEFRGSFARYTQSGGGYYSGDDDENDLSPLEDKTGQLFRKKFGGDSFPINEAWETAKKRVVIHQVTKAGWTPVEVKLPLFTLLEKEYAVDENIEALINFKPLPFLENFLKKHRRKMYSKAVREMESTIELLSTVEGKK